jgi:hypothetical protein
VTRHDGPLRACAISALLFLSACGSDSGGTTPTPITTPTPTPTPVRQTVFQRNVAMPSLTGFAVELTTDRAGTIDVTVDYTFVTSDIVLLIANGRCTEEQLNADQCTFAATSFEGPKPRTLALPGAAAGTYTLIVANLSEGDESVVIVVGFTPSAAGAPGVVALKSRGFGGIE